MPRQRSGIHGHDRSRWKRKGVISHLLVSAGVREPLLLTRLESSSPANSTRIQLSINTVENFSLITQKKVWF
ncbi:hypothetical protein RchiOBHm_Chr3g0471411 [Rosa chinensis]|uniref:Uncharacterized protein n=1 Tax=Rosa chinensis TaxID=74649 RepID=A0A2P6RBA9_ROSCH|nr:hypothetical protein RchiOBHm_Chr3g0471411 [Rosa chinensis]